MRNPESITRRSFVKQVTLGTAAVAGGAWLARAAGANERIGVAFIGTGDRASQLMKELLPLTGKCDVEVRAVCDVWRKNREAAVATVKKSGGREPRQLTRFADVLALPEVDAVVIATPDFSHGTILVAALEAGKDVYIEKPMTIDIDSANRALDLARSKSRVVQAGTQRRSDPHFLGAAKFVATGALGTISRLSGSMDVNQARWIRRYDDCHAEDVDWEAFCIGRLKRSFDPRLLRCWQLFRDTSNGIAGLWMTHYADAVHLVTGAKYPDTAVALGGNYVWHDGREHSDTFHALIGYPEGFLFDWGMGMGNASGIHFTVCGTKGTLDLEKWTFTKEGAKMSADEATKVGTEPTVGHMENWLQCLRSRERPHADIQFGHQHAVATIMAAKAAESGRRQHWDGTKRQLIAA